MGKQMLKFANDECPLCPMRSHDANTILPELRFCGWLMCDRSAPVEVCADGRPQAINETCNHPCFVTVALRGYLIVMQDGQHGPVGAQRLRPSVRVGKGSRIPC